MLMCASHKTHVVYVSPHTLHPRPPYLVGVHIALVDHILNEVCVACAVFPETKLNSRVLSLFHSSLGGGWKRAWNENLGIMKLLTMVARAWDVG